MIELALQNLASPIVLSFALGLIAAGLRSDLSVPEAMARGMSIYLLFAIGYKGGVEVAAAGVDLSLALALGSGILLSAGIPLLAFLWLRLMTNLSRIDAAAVAGHYGSISIVTFVAASSLLTSQGVAFEGWLVAVAAVMEAPAIATALWLARDRSRSSAGPGVPWREVLLNGSVVLLLGSFVIGWMTGPAGLVEVEGFLVVPFKGVLCLFLLDMGLVAGRNLLRSRSALSAGPVLFALFMPLLSASLGLGVGLLLGLSTGGVALLATLAASASYIAVPAAMRVALPEADPAVYLTLSLGVTFPFNLAIGVSIYLMAAQALGG
jgi:hypothetical protein